MADLSSLDEQNEKRKQFGNRFLTDPKNVFEHNAWDNVVWDEEQEKDARSRTAEHLKHLAKQQDIAKFEDDAHEFWNQFYEKHENKFFKDRHWLFTEFPELSPEAYLSQEQLAKLVSDSNTMPVAGPDQSHGKVSKLHKSCECQPAVDISGGDHQKKTFPGESAKYRIFEVGCGVGNTVFPILQANNDPDLMVYCCDYSSTAIQLVKENQDYDPHRCHAFVCDISDCDSPVPFPPGSLDIIIMIFILSANNPDKFQAILNRLAGFLKPGGIILFRDYGRYDLAQLRFKKGKCLGENFYVRGDGTRVYFFTQDELQELMTQAGLVEVQNLVDRRLQVNRGKQLKMYRVWIQCKYQKPKSVEKCQENSDTSREENQHVRVSISEHGQQNICPEMVKTEHKESKNAEQEVPYSDTGSIES